MDAILRPVCSATAAGFVAATVGQFFSTTAAPEDFVSRLSTPLCAVAVLSLNAFLSRRAAATAPCPFAEEAEGESAGPAAPRVGDLARQTSFPTAMAKMETGIRRSYDEADRKRDAQSIRSTPESDLNTLPRVDEQPEQPERPRRIMVVDDDSINHMVIKRYLSKAGKYEISKFMSAETALDKLEKLAETTGYTQFPHVVLMDINMPGISGLAAAAMLREQYPGASMSVMVITGHSSSAVKEQALDAGCVDILTKPVKSAELVKKVATAAERCRRRSRPGTDS